VNVLQALSSAQLFVFSGKNPGKRTIRRKEQGKKEEYRKDRYKEIRKGSW